MYMMYVYITCFYDVLDPIDLSWIQSEITAFLTQWISSVIA